MQCLKDEIYVTGNINYISQQQENVTLTFTPTIISDEKFPINIDNKIIYKSDICTSHLRQFHKSFTNFLQTKDSFSYQIFGQSFMDSTFDNIVHSSSLNTSTFKTHLQTVLNKFKSLDVSEIHAKVTSLSFILSVVFVFLLLLFLLALCCCPNLIFTLCHHILSTVFKLMKQFFTFLFILCRNLFTTFSQKLRTYILVHRDEPPQRPVSTPLAAGLPSPPPYSPSPPISQPLFSPTS